MPRKSLSADVTSASEPARKRLNRKRKAIPALAKPLKSDHQIDSKGRITAKPIPATTPAASKPRKQDVILDLLHQPSGAALDQLTAATGWQAHSIRGFLSGTVRKKLGLSLVSNIVDGRRRYRIEGGAT